VGEICSHNRPVVYWFCTFPPPVHIMFLWHSLCFLSCVFISVAIVICNRFVFLQFILVIYHHYNASILNLTVYLTLPVSVIHLYASISLIRVLV
jgi:hypothetical protein